MNNIRTQIHRLASGSASGTLVLRAWGWQVLRTKKLRSRWKINERAAWKDTHPKRRLPKTLMFGQQVSSPAPLTNNEPTRYTDEQEISDETRTARL